MTFAVSLPRSGGGSECLFKDGDVDADSCVAGHGKCTARVMKTKVEVVEDAETNATTAKVRAGAR